MLIGLFVLAAVLAVVIRGGQLSALADVRFRAPWLALAALGLQIGIITLVPGGSADLHRAIHLGSYGVVAAFVIANWRTPYLWLISLGGACNFAAIAANGGVMPASRSALETAGVHTPPGEFINSTHVPDAHLQMLGDVFAIPGWLPVSNVFSIGDVLIVLGVLLALNRICGARPFALPRLRPRPVASPAAD